MIVSARGARRTATALLGGATLLATLSSIAATPASAVGSLIHVSVNDKATAVVGTAGVDRVVLSGTAKAKIPLLHVDAATPLDVGTGCQPVVGDRTQALCALTFDGTTTLGVQALTLGGDDFIGFGGSADFGLTMVGGSGRDTIVGGPFGELLIGQEGDDVLRGGGGDDDLEGGDGVDQLFGGEGDNDVLDGGKGPDVFDGGPGSADKVSYLLREARVEVDLASTGANLGEIGEGDRIAGGVEAAEGGSGHDSLKGNDGNNHLSGGWAGNDMIAGGPGYDVVLGGDGQDYLSGNRIDLTGQSANADGFIDIIDGQAHTDNCVRSATDGDLVANCEIIMNQH